MPKDESNPYFTYDPSKCIVCSRCVRACEEVQGTFALTIEGRGFESRVSPGMHQDFLSSECVSCGACVQACPTATLTEKSVIEIGQPEHSVVTTCAYCGVGCSFKAEMRGEELVRMVPWKDGKANRGHSCVKGRFAYGYATHKERILNPMVREKISDPVARSELGRGARAYRQRVPPHPVPVRQGLDRRHHLLALHQRGNLYRPEADPAGLRQQQCRHLRPRLPLADRLRPRPDLRHLGRHAGFRLRRESDVIMVIGANPSAAHPVFASRMKKRIRQGAKLIVLDPRVTETVDSVHAKADVHLPLKPGTNVAVVTALAHVIVTEGLFNEQFIRERCDWSEFEDYASFVADAQFPGGCRQARRRRSGDHPRGRAALRHRRQRRDLLRPRRHRAQPGLDDGDGIANLAMLTGNIGRRGVGVNPLRGQNNVQGSCDMGSFPHELPGYRHISGDAVRDIYESLWGVKLDNEPGLRIPNMLDAAVEGTFKGIYIQGEDILQSDPDTKHVSAGLAAMECVVVHDLFLNETANYAHVFLPGSTFLEKDGTFTNAERRINRVRKVMSAEERLCRLGGDAEARPGHGADWAYTHPSQIMDEIAMTTPSFQNVSYALLDEKGSVQWPCNEKAPEGTPIMHVGGFVRGKGKFIRTEYVATDEKTGPRFPLLLTTGRILSQYNVGAQTRRTENVIWHDQDVLEIHPHDAEQRGVRDGDWVRLTSRAGETTLRAQITDRVSPGVVYTTFHHPDTQANVITTDFSDWATNCPEYKVTAVQVGPSNGPSEWQEEYEELSRQSRRIAGRLEAAE
jgi:formate dehydrogenase major subunit